MKLIFLKLRLKSFLYFLKQFFRYILENGTFLFKDLKNSYIFSKENFSYILRNRTFGKTSSISGGKFASTKKNYYV